MKNELLHIGNFTVYGYGLMIGIGILSAYYTLEYRARKQKLNANVIFGLFLAGAFGGFAGAKLLFWITEWKDFVTDPIYYLSHLSDGFVVFGGILGGILAGYLYCRIRKLPFLKYFDLTMPSIALAQGFGRIGCLLAGCCYGQEAHTAFSITFRHSEFAPNDVALVPTQIYSSIFDFAHFMILLKIAHHSKKSGQVAACYLIFYSLGRFVIEFFRGDLIRGSVGVLSTSQFISLFTFAVGIFLLVARTAHNTD